MDASSSNAQHTSSCFSSSTTTSFSTCCSFIVYSASIKSTRFSAGHQHIFYVDTHISLMSIIYIFYTPLSNISLTKFVFSLESSFIYFIAYISYKIFVHMYWFQGIGQIKVNENAWWSYRVSNTFVFMRCIACGLWFGGFLGLTGLMAGRFLSLTGPLAPRVADCPSGNAYEVSVMMEGS